MKAVLALEDGSLFKGNFFGAPGECIGEVVFNTSMTGYQEILTDPSYTGQIVIMTYPLIGNTGINLADMESNKPQIEGLAVKEYCSLPSNWRSSQPLGDFLKDHNITGIQGIDTRALVRHIRLKGAMKGILSTKDLDPKNLLKKVQAFPSLIGQDLVHKVSCPEPYHWTEGLYDIEKSDFCSSKTRNRYRVAVYDFGIKKNILRYLVQRGCDVTVFPADAPAEQLLEINPDGIFLSNGPGDPEPISYAVKNIQKLIHKLPTFGICLGHQLISLALGGLTYKMKFGHRGSNQPVKQLHTGKIEITSQNHGFAVDIDSLDQNAVEITHINLNDRTLEGLRHKELPLFSVQYHPEASAGPHDAEYLFDEFIKLIKTT